MKSYKTYDLPCAVEGCKNPVRVKKSMLCNAHWLMTRRKGRTHRIRMDPSKNHCGDKQCPAAQVVHAHVHYLRRMDVYKAKAERWRRENPERYQQRLRDYFGREDIQERVRQRAKQWRADNPERKRAADKKFAAENPGLVNSYKAARRARVRNAMPDWLTDWERQQIAALYEDAKAWTEMTGVKYEVDHIVPLQGKHVCGLHVPGNIRIITKEANNRRPRVWAAMALTLNLLLSFCASAPCDLQCKRIAWEGMLHTDRY